MSSKELSDYLSAGKHGMLCPVEWSSDGIDLIDQRVLPHEFKINHYDDVRTLSEAITNMVVRGAPAIGITVINFLAEKGTAPFPPKINGSSPNIAH